MIRRTHHGLEYAFNANTTSGDRLTAQYAIITYGFIIDRNETLTADAFADRIAEQFEPTLQRAAILRSIRASL